MEKFEQTKFITGLRAYSALAVFLIHSGGAGLRQLSGFTDRIVDYGKFGVVSFFVISAFTISMSVNSSAKFNFTNYLKKRVLRIAPMYYLVILVAFFFTEGIPYYNDLFGVTNDAYGLVLHLTLLNIFDVRYINNLIGVEGTVPIEFFYYLIVPFIFFYFKKRPDVIINFLTISLVASLLSYHIFHWAYNPIHPGISHNMSLEKYFFTFMIGIATYYIYQRGIKVSANSITLGAWIMLLFVLIYLDISKPYLYISVWISGLIIFCLSKNWLSRLIFENRVIEYIGKISYSIYLLHYPILQLVPKDSGTIPHFLASLMCTLVISSITYELIERPFIKLGRANRSYNVESK